MNTQLFIQHHLRIHARPTTKQKRHNRNVTSAC
jgi:hypothetical protein